jgi:hypothetical protein
MDLELNCVVCGSPLYNTDRSFHETTFHCSSLEARFWDFERGSEEQVNAKDHWDKSKKEILNGSINNNL